MSHYKHLTRKERESLLYYMAKGYTQSKIAKELGRSRSTICREVRRNSTQAGVYSPSTAEARYRKRREKSRRKKLLAETGLYEVVKEKLLIHHWSPEQIAGRLKLEGSASRISYPTIYRAIYSGMFDTPEQRSSSGNGGAKRSLRHKGKPRRGKGYVERRGKMDIPHSITQRPQAANERKRLGDWEADTVLGKQGGPCLLTLVDRRSRLLLCRKLDRRGSKELAQAAVQTLQGHTVRTITPDRGLEFRSHAQISQALDGVQFYFALPHHPWQRGTNENTNGLLREFFPKGRDLTNVSPELIQAVQDELNFRPRKCLAFRSPAEIHFSLLLHLT